MDPPAGAGFPQGGSAPRARGDGPLVHSAQEGAPACSPRTRGWTRGDRPVRTRGDLLAARLDLTTAHLSAGEWEGALEQITIITATSTGHRTASITQRARRLLPMLGTTRAAPARRIRDQLTQLDTSPSPTPLAG
ncbi:hypothetical protein [Nocardiopsis alba]